MQDNLTSFNGHHPDMDPSTGLSSPVPFNHHDRNHSLPNTSFQGDNVPLKVKLNRAATVSKTEDMRKYSASPTNPTMPDTQEAFQLNQYSSSEIHIPDPSTLSSNIHSHAHQVHMSESSSTMPITQHAPMPIVDLGVASISIPDLPTTGGMATPLQRSPLSHNKTYEDPSVRPIPQAATQSKYQPGNEGKIPSEYALHILFTQVGTRIHLSF